MTQSSSVGSLTQSLSDFVGSVSWPFLLTVAAISACLLTPSLPPPYPPEVVADQAAHDREPAVEKGSISAGADGLAPTGGGRRAPPCRTPATWTPPRCTTSILHNLPPPRGPACHLQVGWHPCPESACSGTHPTPCRSQGHPLP